MASIRLTNYVRDAFIAAAMNDVPTIDYDEQTRSLSTHGSMPELPYEEHLGLAKPGRPLYSEDIRSLYVYGSSGIEQRAFRRMYGLGYTYDYEHPSDAINDAARGVVEALRCLRAWRIFILTEHLS